MAEIVSIVKATPGNTFFVETEKDSVVTVVTTGIASLGLAFDQVKGDQAAALAGKTFRSSVITTQAT